MKQRISCYVSKKKGKGAVVYNNPINTPDLQNLYTLFNLEEAKWLQHKVFVD